jgi:hypothetical protein
VICELAIDGIISALIQVKQAKATLKTIKDPAAAYDLLLMASKELRQVVTKIDYYVQVEV